MKHYFMKPSALDGMPFFIAVAETRNFRVAGERLGVSASAVSQALRKLEVRLGVPLVHRTTRSVRLSEAGERLYAAVRSPLAEVEAAVAAAGSRATSRGARSACSSPRRRTPSSRGCRS